MESLPFVKSSKRLCTVIGTPVMSLWDKTKTIVLWSISVDKFIHKTFKIQNSKCKRTPKCSSNGHFFAYQVYRASTCSGQA